MKLEPLLILVPLWVSAATVRADTLTVTTTADSGTGSLRERIAAAASGDTIAITAAGTITLTSGELVVRGKDLVIAGPGATELTVTTNASSRAFRIIDAQCAISGLSFDRCAALSGDIDTGGAIAVDNFTEGGGANVTTVTDCAFTGNESGWGGAVDIFHGGLVMARCTFADNACTGTAFGTRGGGGALSIGATAAATITNCTFSHNRQDGAAPDQPGGGAIYNYGTGPADPAPVTIEHCTFLGNVDSAGAAGAVKGNQTGSYRTWALLGNCLLVDNQAPAGKLTNFAGDPTGPITAAYGSLGGNVTDEGVTSGGFMTGGGDLVGSGDLAATVAPDLALNGGITGSHAITRGSPAQRRGRASSVAVDQRGAPRHPRPDAGAFELVEPELAVTVAGIPVAEPGPVDVGSTPFGTPLATAITIANTQDSLFSTGPLVLGDVAVPAGFAITGFPTSALENGESVTFDLTLAAAPGLHAGPMTFTANDAFDPELAAGGGSANLHAIDLAGLVTDTIDRWRREHFGAGATNAGDAADGAAPAGDGITNLFKYSLGLDPGIAYPPGTGIDGGLDPDGFLVMSVARNPAATDVLLAIEVSDLSAECPWNTGETTILADTPTLLQARDTLPVTPGRRRFIRLSVSLP